MKENMILSKSKKAALACAGVLALAGLALADDTTSGYSSLETMGQPQIVQVLQITPGYTYMPDADFDHSDLGEVSVWRADVPVHYTIKTEPGDLRLGAFYEHSEYDFDDNPDASYESFNTLAFDLLWKSLIDDNWGYFLYGGVGMSAATDETLSDGLTGVGGAGVQYVWSEKLSLGLGAAVATRMEDDPRVLPIIALNWQISENWHLRTLNGATLTWDISGEKTFLLDLGARYQRREFRSDSNTSLTETMMSAELGATYNFSRNFGLRGFVGITGGREIEERHSDSKVGDEDVDSSPFVGVRAFITF